MRGCSNQNLYRTSVQSFQALIWFFSLWSQHKVLGCHLRYVKNCVDMINWKTRFKMLSLLSTSNEYRKTTRSVNRYICCWIAVLWMMNILFGRSRKCYSHSLADRTPELVCSNSVGTHNISPIKHRDYNALSLLAQRGDFNVFHVRCLVKAALDSTPRTHLVQSPIISSVSVIYYSMHNTTCSGFKLSYCNY